MYFITISTPIVYSGHKSLLGSIKKDRRTSAIKMLRENANEYQPQRMNTAINDELIVYRCYILYYTADVN
jgi:hypothetical protein